MYPRRGFGSRAEKYLEKIGNEAQQAYAELLYMTDIRLEYWMYELLGEVYAVIKSPEENRYSPYAELVKLMESQQVVKKLATAVATKYHIPRDKALAVVIAALLVAAGITPYSVNREYLRDLLKTARRVLKDRIYSAGKTPGHTLAEIISVLRARARLSRPKTRWRPPPQYQRIEQLAESLARFVAEAGEQSIRSGLVSGIRPMRSLEEVRDLAPGERAVLSYAHVLGPAPPGPQLRALEAYRLISHQAMVFDRRFRVYPVVFIDISDSMKSLLAKGLSRYMFAAAIGIALIRALGKGELYLFDERVYPVSKIAKNPQELEKILLYNYPAGGTNISKVLSTIIGIEEGAKSQEEKPIYIIITDSIDIVPREVINEIKRHPGLAERILVLLTLSPHERPKEWVREFPHLKVSDDKALYKAMLYTAQQIEKTLLKAS